MRKFLVFILIILCSSGPALPQYAAGITPCSSNSISVSGTSANVQLSTCAQTILLWNVSTQELFYNFGTASSTAATTSNYSLPGNSFIVLNLGTPGGAAYYLAAITGASTTTLRITQGHSE